MSEKALVPVEQKTVVFYEDEVTAVIVEIDGKRQVYIPLRPICDHLGLDWSAQRQRIIRDMVLSEVAEGVVVITTPSESGRGGGPQETLCLPLDYLNGWLFGVNANRVKEENRPTLLRYQRECYRVLYEAMREGGLSADVSFDDLLDQASAETVEAYRMALAIVKLARNQVVIEAQIGQHGRVLEDYGRRLESIEATLSNPDRYISREQASRISQAVRAIGHVLSERSGRSEFGAVYGELYRSFEISAYRELPASKYDQAMAWLNAWYQRLTNNDIPF